MVQYSIRKPIKALWVDAFAKLAALRETDLTSLDLPGSVSVIFFVAQNEKTKNPCMVSEVLHSFRTFHLNKIYWSVSKILYRICIIFCPNSGGDNALLYSWLTSCSGCTQSSGSAAHGSRSLRTPQTTHDDPGPTQAPGPSYPPPAHCTWEHGKTPTVTIRHFCILFHFLNQRCTRLVQSENYTESRLWIKLHADRFFKLCSKKTKEYMGKKKHPLQLYRVMQSVTIDQRVGGQDRSRQNKERRRTSNREGKEQRCAK